MIPLATRNLVSRATYKARSVLRAAVAIVPAILSYAGHYSGQVLVAGFGAFAGTIVAFRLERSAREREQRHVQLIAALSARASLRDMRSIIGHIERVLKSGGIAQYQQDAWLIIDVQVGQLLPPRSVDYTALAFLYTGKHKEIIAAIRNAETHFWTFRQSFEMRNDLMERIVLPAMSEPMEQGTQQMTEEERLIRKVGTTPISKVQYLTKLLFDTHTPLLSEIDKVTSALDVAIQENFPEDEIGK